MITRRELLHMVSCAIALPAGREFFGSWLSAARPHQTSGHLADPALLRDYRPTFFDADNFAALQAFTEILIPTDDTPGAREAHCAHFIDFVLAASVEESPGPVRQWRAALRALKDAGFHSADGPARHALVEAMSRPERERGAMHPAYAAYRLIKQQNTFAFYTSRAGIIVALDYKGNSYNATFPACEHEEHRRVP